MKKASKHTIKMRVLTAALVVSTSCYITNAQDHSTMRQRQKVLFEIEAPDRPNDLISAQHDNNQQKQQLVEDHSMYGDVEEKLTRKRMVATPAIFTQPKLNDESITVTDGRTISDVISKWNAMDRYLEFDLSLSLSMSMSM